MKRSVLEFFKSRVRLFIEALPYLLVAVIVMDMLINHTGSVRAVSDTYNGYNRISMRSSDINDISSRSIKVTRNGMPDSCFYILDCLSNEKEDEKKQAVLSYLFSEYGEEYSGLTAELIASVNERTGDMFGVLANDSYVWKTGNGFCVCYMHIFENNRMLCVAFIPETEMPEQNTFTVAESEYIP